MIRTKTNVFWNFDKNWLVFTPYFAARGITLIFPGMTSSKMMMSRFYGGIRNKSRFHDDGQNWFHRPSKRNRFHRLTDRDTHRHTHRYFSPAFSYVIMTEYIKYIIYQEMFTVLADVFFLQRVIFVSSKRFSGHVPPLFTYPKYLDQYYITRFNSQHGLKSKWKI